MALKPDEIFVSESLVKFLGKEGVTYQEGEDPPDIYLTINGEKVAVEITRLSPVVFGEDGEMQNRNTQDTFGVNLCNELDSKLKNKVPQDIDILLVLHLPVNNARKYKKELFKLVESVLAKPIKEGSSQTTSVLGHKIKIIFIPKRRHSNKKIVGAIVNDNSQAHILSNAVAILADRIHDKVLKCKNIPHSGPKWLALYNDYWLADSGTYSMAIKNIQEKHDFQRILIVSDQGVVSELSET
ncbi:hypothetical protein DSCW_17740 [Desulfosarcina widdelii]|uniref:Uncharacterized protein n=1 Tax=Desulfosarcina widdelii TaxID=947919 RepID=A0A5K7ZDM7_9BACT|nr:hypothetical protein [Desulfosarcina widdelii]BBO74357.1 hypothetical protein DSCW_17740 [Desulfosarcina widdelii]